MILAIWWSSCVWVMCGSPVSPSQRSPLPVDARTGSGKCEQDRALVSVHGLKEGRERIAQAMGDE